MVTDLDMVDTTNRSGKIIKGSIASISTFLFDLFEPYGRMSCIVMVVDTIFVLLINVLFRKPLHSLHKVFVLSS